VPYPPEGRNVCSCSGKEFGYHDRKLSRSELRTQWQAKGARWFSTRMPQPEGWNAQDQRLPVRGRKSMWRALRPHDNLLLGEHPPSGFGQVAPHGDHGLLVIFGASDPLIQPHYMSSGEPALVDHYQIADLHESPLQISVHVSAHLRSMATVGRALHGSRDGFAACMC
jgi:hypothetical protein